MGRRHRRRSQAVQQQLAARLEYLHYDFGDSGNSVSNGTTSFSSGNLTADVIRTGLSYKFGGDAFVPASAGAAYGAMPVKAPVRVAAPWAWDGFYIGAHAGYGWFRHPFDEQPFDPGDTLSGVNSSGFLAGFQAGANWQHGSWVGGLEIDLSAANIKGSASNTRPARQRRPDRVGNRQVRSARLVACAARLSAHAERAGLRHRGLGVDAVCRDR